MLRRENIEESESAGKAVSARPLLLVLGAVVMAVGGVAVAYGERKDGDARLARKVEAERLELNADPAAAAEVFSARRTRDREERPVPAEPELQVTEEVPGRAAWAHAAPEEPTVAEQIQMHREQAEVSWDQEGLEALRSAMRSPGEVSLSRDLGGSKAGEVGAEDGGGAGLDKMGLSEASVALMNRHLAQGGGGRLPHDRPLGPLPAQTEAASAKRAFFEHGGEDVGKAAIVGDRQRHASPYALLQGTMLPGKLITEINSDLPGLIKGQVTEDVYDTATGRYLLIPRGTFVVGTYSSEVTAGQSRVQVAWTRLNFPDGSFLDLGSMPGGSASGKSGLEDRVNRHFGRRLGMALLLSTLTVSHEVTTPVGQNGGSAVHRGAGDAVVQLGSDLARQEMNIPPTIEIRTGARFVIQVNRDLVFEEAYERRVR